MHMNSRGFRNVSRFHSNRAHALSHFKVVPGVLPKIFIEPAGAIDQGAFCRSIAYVKEVLGHRSHVQGERHAKKPSRSLQPGGKWIALFRRNDRTANCDRFDLRMILVKEKMRCDETGRRHEIIREENDDVAEREIESMIQRLCSSARAK